VACWSTKAAISLKRVEIEEKLPWRSYRNSPTVFRTVPSPTPYGLLFPNWGSQPSLQTPVAIISGTDEATNFKFCSNIHRFIRTKFWRKGSVGVSRDCPNFLGVPPNISGTCFATNFEFGWNIHSYGPSERKPIKKFW